MKQYKNIATSLFILAAVLMSGCKQSNNNNPADERYCLDSTFLSQIEWVTPKMAPISEGIHLTGTVETNPDRVVHFASLINGIVSGVYFSLGDKVTKGQVLADLRSTELSDLQSQNQSIAAQIRVAEKKLESVQAMFGDGVSSQKELAEAQSELLVLKAERQKINANLSLYSASTERGVFRIKAPVSGIITAKSIAAGTPVAAGSESLFTVSDLSNVWVMLNVHTSNVKNITPGMDVNIKTLSYPDESFPGKVANISNVLDADAKVLKAKVVIPNANLKLKPGMPVDVTAYRHVARQALSIPVGAVVFDNNENFVVVFKDTCNLEIRPVNITYRTDQLAYLDAGADADEKIISKNHLLIYEQLKNFRR